MQSTEYANYSNYLVLGNTSPQNLVPLSMIIIFLSPSVSMDPESGKAWLGRSGFRSVTGVAIRQELRLTAQGCWTAWGTVWAPLST